MYTSHPPEDELHEFATPSMVAAARKNVSICFSEFLAMRRLISTLADSIQAANPDLVPFFATGGIPFMIPTMRMLAQRNCLDMLRGRHFHMFPGLAWNGKREGVDSEIFFAKEFGALIADRASANGNVRVWTMDATFTGNALLRMLKTLHLAFAEADPSVERAIVSVVAVIDASRARKKAEVNTVELGTAHGTLYLQQSSEFAPSSELIENQPCKFRRRDGNDLFDLEITFRAVASIPTEDRAELIGAHAQKTVLGIERTEEVGRLTFEMENGFAPTGTGGGTIASNVLNYLSSPEDRMPWSIWIPASLAPPVQDPERSDLELARATTRDFLRLWELRASGDEDVISSLMEQKTTLEAAEVHYLLEMAEDEFYCGGMDASCIPANLQRSVLAAAKTDPECASDALKLMRLCNLMKAAKEPQDLDDSSKLDWWRNHISREPRSRKR